MPQLKKVGGGGGGGRGPGRASPNTPNPPSSPANSVSRGLGGNRPSPAVGNRFGNPRPSSPPTTNGPSHVSQFPRPTPGGFNPGNKSSASPSPGRASSAHQK
ncbi:hypothetical protein GBAR_LOCUS29865, partial [Geodia barretti]